MDQELNQLKERVQYLEQIITRFNKDKLIPLVGPGNSTLTQTITIGADGGSASVPAAYRGTKIINVDGEFIEIPYL